MYNNVLDTCLRFKDYYKARQLHSDIVLKKYVTRRESYLHFDEIIRDEESLADIELKKEEKNIAQNKIFQELHSALVNIKPKYQEVIVLRFFEKKSIDEIAQITKKVNGTIKSLLHRGLQKLKEELGSSLYEDFTNE